MYSLKFAILFIFTRSENTKLLSFCNSLGRYQNALYTNSISLTVSYIKCSFAKKTMFSLKLIENFKLIIFFITLELCIQKAHIKHLFALFHASLMTYNIFDYVFFW